MGAPRILLPGPVRTRVLAGTLHLSGWWFDIASGSMYAYERESRRFEIIDGVLADRLIARMAAREQRKAAMKAP